MKFGIFLPLQCPRPWSPESESRLVAEVLEQAELADRLGYDCVWTQEHHFLEEYSHASAPEVLLAAISQRTSRIRLGHGVMLMLPAYNHPARCAERIAMLDLVSGGRVEWGMGASSSEAELGAFGIDPAHKHLMWEEGARSAIRMLVEQPFTGVDGRYVKMPSRNLVPRSVQKPHPPLWMACANRQTMRHAARMGLGALTFAFIDPQEARHWVDEYYEVFESSCHPLGAAVNPNVAMLSNFVCHPDRDEAQRRGLEGAAFFAYGLGHYFRGGAHLPGQTDLWAEFQGRSEDPYLGLDRFNTPAGLSEHFAALEEAGVDQCILLQQAGGYRHEHILESMALFAREALPAFKARDAARERAKSERLSAAVARAQALIAERDGRAAPLHAVEATPSADTHERRTLLDDLAWHAQHRGSEPALCELDPAAFTRREMRYDALLQAVLQRAGAIAACVAPGSAVLVVGDAGIDPFISILAAMRAGAVAVPAPTPTPGRGIERLRAIVRVAGPSLVVGLRDDLATLREDMDAPTRASLQWLAVDEPAEPSVPAALPVLDPGERALLQFTSGSTQQPKGVPHTHEMLRATLVGTAALFGYRRDDRFLTILPVYHTLALTAHLASALHVGACGYTLEPFAFAQSPAAWLAALSRHRITVSAAPNFAYARCARLPAEAVPPGLDLSAWRVAMNGGEPPQADAIDAFCTRWAEHGLRAEAMSPSYGMTEAAGTISGRPAGVGMVRLQVDGAALRGGRLQPGTSGPTLVSNGRVAPGLALAVVVPEGCVPCREGEIGELCIRGRSVITAYEGPLQAQAGRFVTLGAGTPWLRTGDLGAQLGGEIYLTGRRHDLIIVRGENFFPDDIEQAVRSVCTREGVTGVAALGVPEDGTDALVLLIEADGTQAVLRADAQAAREAVAQQLGVRATRVAFVAAGKLPRTPIGKLRRSDARAAWLDGSLPVVLELSDEAGVHDAAGHDASDRSPEGITRALTRLWCRQLQCDAVGRDKSFFELGGDSLLAVETLHAINTQFGVDFALTDTVRDFTIDRLVRRIVQAGSGTAAAEPARAMGDGMNGLRLRELRAHDVESVTALLVEACLRVPLYAMAWSDLDAVRGWLRTLVQGAAQEGLSQVVVDETTQEIVAANVSGARDARLAVPGSIGESLPDDPLSALELELTRRLMACGAALEVPVLMLDWLAVDRRYEGRNLGPRLLEANLSAAQEKGFVTAVAHPTSLVTQHMLQREYGFLCVARQESRRFEFEGRCPFDALPPTDSMCLMVRSLRHEPRRGQA